MSFSSEPAFDGLKTISIENALGSSLRYQVSKIFLHFVHSRASYWQNLHTLLTVLRNNGIILQEYYSVMPALCMMLQI